MTELYVGTPKLTNFLTSMAQNKMNQENEERRRKAELNTPQNLLAAKQLGYADEDRQYQLRQREQADEDKRISHTVSALNLAMKADTPEKAKAIYKTVLPDGIDADFSFIKPDEKSEEQVTITYSNGAKFSGPRSQIIEATQAIANDPTYITDPEKNRHLAAWSSARGLSLTMPQTETEKPQYKHIPVYNTEGKIIKFKSVREDQDFTYDTGTSGNISTTVKPEMTVSDALKRISDIQKSKASLGQASTWSAMLAKEYPKAASSLGKPISDNDKTALNQAWDKEIAYLTQFTVPDGTTGTYQGKKVIRKNGKWEFQ